MTQQTSLADIAAQKWRETHRHDEFPRKGDRIYLGYPHYTLMEYAHIDTLGWCAVPLTNAGAISEAHKHIERVEEELAKTRRELADMKEIAELVTMSEPEMTDSKKPAKGDYHEPGDAGFAEYTATIYIDALSCSSLKSLLRVSGYEIPDGIDDHDRVECKSAEIEVRFHAYYPEYNEDCQGPEYEPGMKINGAGHAQRED